MNGLLSRAEPPGAAAARACRRYETEVIAAEFEVRNLESGVLLEALNADVPDGERCLRRDHVCHAPFAQAHVADDDTIPGERHEIDFHARPHVQRRQSHADLMASTSPDSPARRWPV